MSLNGRLLNGQFLVQRPHTAASSTVMFCLRRLKAAICVSSLRLASTGQGTLSAFLSSPSGSLESLEQVMSVLHLAAMLGVSRAGSRGMARWVWRSCWSARRSRVCMVCGEGVQQIGMKRSRSRKGRSSQVPLFISKLLQMVENSQILEVIGWTSSGDSFNIKQVGRFTEEILPRYFKHRNFSSFIRQLNMYGFRKTRHPDGENVYMHEHFRAGHRQLLRHINRKMRDEREERVAVHQGAGRGEAAREMQELRTRQKSLEQMCRHFFIQNQKLMQENQNIIRRMEREAREKEKRLEEFLVQLAFRALPADHAPLALTEHPHPHEPQDSHTSSHTSHDSDHWRRVQALLERIYCDPPAQQPPRPAEPEDEENSYMSINDFINADDYDNDINLDDSR